MPIRIPRTQYAQIGARQYRGARLRELRARIAREAVWVRFDPAWLEHLSYQACRFCTEGSYGTRGGGLYKYGVRHYVCEPCVGLLDPCLPERLNRRAFLPSDER